MSGADAREQALAAAYAALGPVRLRYCPLTPTPRQEAFLRLWQREVFFGGAAGGGKSVGLFMSGLQYADVPGYHALLLRPSLTEFQLPGGLIDLSHDWLATSKAHWLGELKQWRFPGPGRNGAGGATVGFGYLDSPSDVNRYAGSSYSFLGFDELTKFTEQQYRRMFRVLRQPSDHTHTRLAAAADGTRLSDVPIRVRSASNPGGPGHDWVKTRFVDPTSRHPDVIYLPSRLADNPHLDQHTYQQSLAELPSAERERLLHGDWNVPEEGELFQREWFQVVDPAAVPERTSAVRFWDLAATQPTSAAPDPDYTVGLRLDLHPQTGVFYITDIVRTRKPPGTIERLIADTAQRDGPAVAILIEQEPGAAGVALADRYKRHVLRGYNVRARRVTGSKLIRAQPVAAAAENGLIKIVRGRNLHDFLEEAAAFPNAAHDDCIDALSGAHTALSKPSPGPATVSLPKGRLPELTPWQYPTIAARSHRRLPANDEELAAMIGVPLYDPRKTGW